MNLIRVALVLLVAASAGCQSRPLGPYSSPRVVGRVVDANTGRPLAGVQVIRGKSSQEQRADWEPKGGQLLMEKAPVRTDGDGRFALPSERVLTVIRGAGWNSARLTFEHPGYERFQTNLSLTVSTNTPSAEPVVNAGKIPLRPLAR